MQGVFNGVPGYLASCSASKAHIGLILLHEWWGLNKQMRSLADRFAQAGFLTLVPDLYRGKVASEAGEASHLMEGLDWNVAVQDVDQVAKYLCSQGAQKVGVMGFCMGGALSIAAATKIPIDAAVCFYGVPPKTVADPKDIACPIQLHFGELDNSVGFSDPKTADELESVLKAENKRYSFYRYPADHAFMNALRPEVFDKECSDLAFCRATNFLSSL